MWGHRSAISTRKGGGFYGYRLHAAVCQTTGLPVAWQVETASTNESNFALPLLDAARERNDAARERGFAIEACVMDKGYDSRFLYDGCESRDIRPIVPLRQTYAVKHGHDAPPSCEHGEWRFAGPTTAARPPSGAARPASASQRVDGSRPTGSTR